MTSEPYLAPYARTLLEVAQEKGELDVVREEVEALLGIFAGEPRLQLLLESPRVEEHEKLGVVEAVLAGKCNETLYRFVRLVVDKGRSPGLRDMLELFLAEHDRLIGRVNVEVTTAVPLDDELASGLQGTLEKRLDKTVVLERNVDEDILGGVVVRFEGMVADASLRSELERLKSDMLALRLGSELVHED